MTSILRDEVKELESERDENRQRYLEAMKKRDDLQETVENVKRELREAQRCLNMKEKVRSHISSTTLTLCPSGDGF